MPCHHHYFSFTEPKGDGNLQSAGTDCARVGRYGIILIGIRYENIANDKKNHQFTLSPTLSITTPIVSFTYLLPSKVLASPSNLILIRLYKLHIEHYSTHNSWTVCSKKGRK